MGPKVLKRCSQEAFDEVVQGNIDDFEMVRRWNPGGDSRETSFPRVSTCALTGIAVCPSQARIGRTLGSKDDARAARHRARRYVKEMRRRAAVFLTRGLK